MENVEQHTYKIGTKYYHYQPTGKTPHFVGILEEIDAKGWKKLVSSQGVLLYASQRIDLPEASMAQISSYF